jgi:hypothetical protein
MHKELPPVNRLKIASADMLTNKKDSQQRRSDILSSVIEKHIFLELNCSFLESLRNFKDITKIGSNPWTSLKKFPIV